MSGQFQPIQIPPGVVSMPTKAMKSSNWAEANLMRWIEGEMQPVGGQAPFTYTFASRCKAIHPWFDLNQILHVAFVCEQHVYVDTAGSAFEITPTGGWPAPPMPAQGGYSDLNYNDDTYGTPRSGSSVLPTNKMPNVWSVDNFGAVLLVMNSVDGRLLQWDPAVPGTPLTPITPGSGTPAVPTGRCFVVTPQRFVIIFGAVQGGSGGVGGSFRRFAWCDQQDITDWNFSSTVNQAGFLDIEPASPIVTAISGRFGTLMWTGKKAYIIQFLGLPYIYNYTELADNCTPWSPASMATTSSFVVWMSQQGMFAFDGTSITPIPCLVRPWVTDDIDPANVREQACGVHVYRFNEFWWFYPQNGQPYNTRCIIFNYKEGWWSQGQMSRSAGIVGSYLGQPIMADGLKPFMHEVGLVYANAAAPWAETYDLNLTSGTKLVTLKQVIPNIKGDMANVQFSFFSRMSRSLDVSSPPRPVVDGTWTNPVPIRPDGYVDARVTGRDIRMRLSLIGPSIQLFTVGQHLMDFAVRGDR